jgi:hypothetical protein
MFSMFVPTICFHVFSKWQYFLKKYIEHKIFSVISSKKFSLMFHILRTIVFFQLKIYLLLYKIPIMLASNLSNMNLFTVLVNVYKHQLLNPPFWSQRTDMQTWQALCCTFKMLTKHVLTFSWTEAAVLDNGVISVVSFYHVELRQQYCCESDNREYY